jgi:hypothetical protein
MPRRIDLTSEQIALVRRLWAEGESQQQIAAAIGIGFDTLKQRLRDQLTDLPKRSRTANSDRRGQELTPEEITLRCAEVRSRWPEERWLPLVQPDYSRLGRAALDAAEYRG